MNSIKFTVLIMVITAIMAFLSGCATESNSNNIVQKMAQIERLRRGCEKCNSKDCNVGKLGSCDYFFAGDKKMKKLITVVFILLSVAANASGKTITIEWQVSSVGRVYTEILSCGTDCEKTAEKKGLKRLKKAVGW